MLVCPKSYRGLSPVLEPHPNVQALPGLCDSYEKGFLTGEGWFLEEASARCVFFFFLHVSPYLPQYRGRDWAGLCPRSAEPANDHTSWPPSAFSVAAEELTQQNSLLKRAKALTGQLVQPPGSARTTKMDWGRR